MSLKRKMPAFPLPVFCVPRFGEVIFRPQGDMPIRKTKQWRVIVRFTGARKGQADQIFSHPSTTTSAPTPYPTADLARFFMLRACSITDRVAPDYYLEQGIVPPLRIPPKP